MNKNNLVKIINKELTIVSDIVNDFANADEIHPFEIDLALSKIKDIYGELLLLKNDKQEIVIDLGKEHNQINQTQASPIEKVVAKEPEKDKASIEPVKEIIEEPVQEIVPDVDQEELVVEPKVKIEEPVAVEDDSHTETVVETEVPEIDIQEKEIEVESQSPKKVDKEPEEAITKEKGEVAPEPEIKEVEAVVEEYSEPIEEEVHSENEIANSPDKNEIIADKFNNTSPSLNDMLAGIQKNKDLASRLGDRPIENLKTAIKINDRIWYVNELFNKDSELYNTTIERINNCNDMDEALSYLFTNFKWDQEKKSTISFLELVFRRFAN